jgi:hypothetical protein
VQQVVDRERPAMSWLNLIEVHYRTTRDRGPQEAATVLAGSRPQITENLRGISAMREVARLETENQIALANCFAVHSRRRKGPYS